MDQRKKDDEYFDQLKNLPECLYTMQAQRKKDDDEYFDQLKNLPEGLYTMQGQFLQNNEKSEMNKLFANHLMLDSEYRKYPNFVLSIYKQELRIRRI